MNPNNSAAPSVRLGFPIPVNPKHPVQLALLPAPEPGSRSLLPVPAQDAARQVVTVYAVGGVL